MALNTTPGDDCESLCTVAEADDYHEKHGNVAAWAPLENTRKEQLLREAYTWLYGRYWARWPAGELFGTVAGVPDPVIMRGARESCARLALYAIAGPLDPEATPQIIRQDVGPIKQEFAPFDNTTGRHFPDIVRLMAPYLGASSPYTVQLRRA